MGKNIKTLRRFLALVMAFGVVAGLCACTQQSSSSAPPSATSSESQTPDAVVAEWPDFLTVGGGSTGGVFFSAAAGIAQLLSSETDTIRVGWASIRRQWDPSQRVVCCLEKTNIEAKQQ